MPCGLWGSRRLSRDTVAGCGVYSLPRAPERLVAQADTPVSPTSCLLAAQDVLCRRRPVSAQGCGEALGRGEGLEGPRGDCGRPRRVLAPRQPPIQSLAESSRLIPSPRWCVAAFHPKTGFEPQ